jgi:hypothetical protein
MAATPIETVDRYFPTGTTKYLFVPTIANPNAPTRAELDAGTDLSPEIREVDGWTVSSDEIETPDINSRFTSKIPGRISADESSITMYADPTGTDARTLLARDTEGWIVRMGGGDTAARKMDLFEITVTSVSKEFGTDDEAGTLVFQFSIKSEPVEDIAIPAVTP